MYYTYEDACEATISRTEAAAEISRHAGVFEEFLADVGDRAEYTGKEILDWLGY